MGTVIGGLGSPHAPSIGAVIDRGEQADPNWRPLFEGFAPMRSWLADQRPDLLIVFFNDHGSTFFFDKYPTFAVGVGATHAVADEGWGKRPLPDFAGNSAFAWHLAHSLVDDRFDIAVCQEMPVDHGVLTPMSALLPYENGWPVPILPIHFNVLQFPVPTPRRCYELGRAIRRAIHSFDGDLRVATVGTGGLSHQLHGERFGHMNPEWDAQFLDLLAEDPEALADLSIGELIRRGGAEGVEMIMWLTMRGTLSERVRCVHRNYYLPMLTGFGQVIYEEANPGPGRGCDAVRETADG